MKKKDIISNLWLGLIIGTFFFMISPEKTLIGFIANFLICTLYSFVLSFGNNLLNCFLDEKYPWLQDTKKRAIIGITATIFLNIILVLFCNTVNYTTLQHKTLEQALSSRYIISHVVTILIVLLITTFMHAKGFFEELKKQSQIQIVEQKLIASSANAKFESLKNQLDPHFLFNSLNVLSSLIDENPEQAQNFTASMSKIYRYVLEQKDKELVTVEEEISFAKTYCELLKTRFEDSVDFEFVVEENELKNYIVPLSLQLLLENCIKHNYATSNKVLNIKIYNQKHTLIIENNLQTRELPNKSSGIGLANIVQRYQLLTKNNVFIEKSEDFFRVKLPILTNLKTTEEKMETDTLTPETQAYQKAVKRVKEIRDFYASLLSYCLVIPFLIFINLYTGGYHWFWFPMLGWGMGIGIHALKTFGVSKDWEERKIKEYMSKNRLRDGN